MAKYGDVFASTFDKKYYPMRTRSRHTVVVIPDENKLEVSYYCSDLKLKEEEKKEFTDLIIQLHDCHTAI